MQGHRPDTLLPTSVGHSMILASSTPLPTLSADVHQARLTSPSRLAALQLTGLLDGAANPVLDRLARLTSRLLAVPVALVSLVDDRQQHFPGLAGLSGRAGEQRGTPLSHSFCQHVVASDRVLLVQDASTHPLVMDNLAFRELGLIAYAGVPLRTADGETLGALCAIDVAPTQWTPEQVSTLEDLATAAMAEIELRATTQALLVAQAQLQAAHDRLRAQAARDALTGLLNRRGFADAARQQLALAERTRTPFVVAALDLDGFKEINDTHGHDVGDEALVEMAVLLTESCRASDLVCRLGGDEFVLLLTNTDAVQVTVVRDRIDAALAAHNAGGSGDYTLGTSVGFAAWQPGDATSLPDLLKAADQAMYADKRRRRGRSDAEACDFSVAS